MWLLILIKDVSVSSRSKSDLAAKAVENQDRKLPGGPALLGPTTV